MNSKFKKIARKFKNIWNFLASRMLGGTRRVQNFVIKWHARSSHKKTKIVYFLQVYFWDKFCFFVHELLQCPNTTKFCTHLPHLSILDAKRIHIFWFFCYFFEFTVHTRTYLLFFLRHELLECPNNMKICTHLANLSTFDPTKFQNFLTFFCYFFEMVKAVWPDGNDAHFY